MRIFTILDDLEADLEADLDDLEDLVMAGVGCSED